MFVGMLAHLQARVCTHRHTHMFSMCTRMHAHAFKMLTGYLLLVFFEHADMSCTCTRTINGLVLVYDTMCQALKNIKSFILNNMWGRDYRCPFSTWADRGRELEHIAKTWLQRMNSVPAVGRATIAVIVPVWGHSEKKEDAIHSYAESPGLTLSIRATHPCAAWARSSGVPRLGSVTKELWAMNSLSLCCTWRS